MTSFSCCAWDDKGNAYGGGSNSKLYTWKDRECTGSFEGHKRGFICSLVYREGKLYSGGKDGQVICWDVSGDAPVMGACVDYGDLVRSVDFMGGKLLVGCRDGTIWHGEGKDKAIMSSHSDGEVWGLA